MTLKRQLVCEWINAWALYALVMRWTLIRPNLDPYLDNVILPLGDSISNKIVLVKDSVVETVEQALVQEELFVVKQEKLEAADKTTPAGR